MGVVMSLVLGWGIWLIVDGFLFEPRATQARSTRRRWLRQLLAEAGMVEVRNRNVYFAMGGSAFLGALVAWLFSGFAIFALLGASAAVTIPVLVIRARARRRRREFREAWPDAVDNLTSAIRAGLALPEAMILLANTGPDALRPAFAKFARDYRDTGRFSDSLTRLKDRLCDPVGDRVVEALRIAREVGGGDIAQMLRTLSVFLREDLRTRAELEARQSWTVSGARLAVAAPWLVLVLMATGSAGLSAFATPIGNLVLVSGAVACVGAYSLMVRLGRLPEEPRVLVS